MEKSVSKPQIGKVWDIGVGSRVLDPGSWDSRLSTASGTLSPRHDPDREQELEVGARPDWTCETGYRDGAHQRKER